MRTRGIVALGTTTPLPYSTTVRRIEKATEAIAAEQAKCDKIMAEAIAEARERRAAKAQGSKGCA
jgi:hypothetical protein